MASTTAPQWLGPHFLLARPPKLSHGKRFWPTRLLRGRCVKVLWRKRGANVAYCCNLATVAKILDELPSQAHSLTKSSPRLRRQARISRPRDCRSYGGSRSTARCGSTCGERLARDGRARPAALTRRQGPYAPCQQSVIIRKKSVLADGWPCSRKRDKTGRGFVVESRPGAEESLPAGSPLVAPRARRSCLRRLVLADCGLRPGPSCCCRTCLLYWSGYPVNAAISLKAILFAAGIALLITTAKSRRFRMAAHRLPRPQPDHLDRLRRLFRTGLEPGATSAGPARSDRHRARRAGRLAIVAALAGDLVGRQRGTGARSMARRSQRAGGVRASRA